MSQLVSGRSPFAKSQQLSVAAVKVIRDVVAGDVRLMNEGEAVARLRLVGHAVT